MVLSRRVASPRTRWVLLFAGAAAFVGQAFACAGSPYVAALCFLATLAGITLAWTLHRRGDHVTARVTLGSDSLVLPDLLISRDDGFSFDCVGHQLVLSDLLPHTANVTRRRTLTFLNSPAEMSLLLRALHTWQESPEFGRGTQLVAAPRDASLFEMLASLEPAPIADGIEVWVQERRISDLLMFVIPVLSVAIPLLLGRSDYLLASGSVGILLGVFFGLNTWRSRSRLQLTSHGLRGPDGTTLPWGRVRSASQSNEGIIIHTNDGEDLAICCTHRALLAATISQLATPDTGQRSPEHQRLAAGVALYNPVASTQEHQGQDRDRS